LADILERRPRGTPPDLSLSPVLPAPGPRQNVDCSPVLLPLRLSWISPTTQIEPCAERSDIKHDLTQQPHNSSHVRRRQETADKPRRGKLSSHTGRDTTRGEGPAIGASGCQTKTGKGHQVASMVEGYKGCSGGQTGNASDVWRKRHEHHRSAMSRIHRERRGDTREMVDDYESLWGR
jgi:hypothetical protein